MITPCREEKLLHAYLYGRRVVRFEISRELNYFIIYKSKCIVLEFFALIIASGRIRYRDFR